VDKVAEEIEMTERELFEEWYENFPVKMSVHDFDVAWWAWQARSDLDKPVEHDGCSGCRYENEPDGKYPCTHCSNGYINQYRTMAVPPVPVEQANSSCDGCKYSCLGRHDGCKAYTPIEKAPIQVDRDGCEYVLNHARFSALHMIQAVRELYTIVKKLEEK
jgi:hypothetical protein